MKNMKKNQKKKKKKQKQQENSSENNNIEWPFHILLRRHNLKEKKS